MNVQQLTDRIAVYDGYIPDHIIDAALSVSLQHGSWTFFQSLGYGAGNENWRELNKLDDCGFSQSFYHEEYGDFNPAFSLLQTLPEFVGNFGRITRCKANLSFPVTATTRGWHRDRLDEHTAMVIYLHDAHGNTYARDGETEYQIEPKRGRVVVMDGSIEHAAGVPEKGIRVILNYNFVKNK